jgi:hypothetical protein
VTSTLPTTLPPAAEPGRAARLLARLLPDAEPAGVPRPNAPQVLAAIVADDGLSLPAKGALAVAWSHYPGPICRDDLLAGGTPPGLVDQVLGELERGRWLARPARLPIGWWVLVDEETSLAWQRGLLGDRPDPSTRWGRRPCPPEPWEQRRGGPGR